MTTIDLNELRSEYESTYLYYFSKQKDYLTFEEWLKRYKKINLKQRQ